MNASRGSQLPDRARVVIIGGGVIGCSVAYHLAHAGWTDVVLLERDRLTCGTTWHAAGLMTCFGSTSETSTAIRLYSRDLYARLEEETGQSTGFKPVGLIEAAADEARLEEYRRVAAFQRHLGLEVEEISPREMADLFPWAKTDDLLAGFHVPGDGRVNPVDLTTALAKGARQLGVTIKESITVEDVLTERGRVTGVRVSTTGSPGETADIEAEYVVNCTGMWARELGAKNGLVIPNQAAEHYYLITDTIEGLDPEAPIFEDPASYGYYREEGGGMMVGLFEPQAAPWRVEGVPGGFSFGTIPPDWDRMTPFLEKAMSRVPITLAVGVRTFFCGPESFTPDLAPAVGEAPGLRNYFVAVGMNSVGVLSAGFILIGRYGLQRTLVIAAALNIAAGLLALALDRVRADGGAGGQDLDATVDEAPYPVSAQRAVWERSRRDGGRCDHLLRFLWLRCDCDRSGRGKESEPRSGDRYRRFDASLRFDLHGHRGRSDRRGRVYWLR